MKSITIAMLAALTLAGCASSKSVPIAADANPQRVNCVPGRLDLCHVQAKQLCPGGYEELRTEDPVVATRPPAAGATSSAAASGATPTSLLITCR
jgi:hypothetical protein